MPRPPRIDFFDAVYHVSTRGNGRADIFFSDDDRQRFLAQLKIAACRRLNARQRLERLNAYRWTCYAGYVAAAKAEEFVCYDVLKERGRNQAARRSQKRPRSASKVAAVVAFRIETWSGRGGQWTSWAYWAAKTVIDSGGKNRL